MTSTNFSSAKNSEPPILSYISMAHTPSAINCTAVLENQCFSEKRDFSQIDCMDNSNSTFSIFCDDDDQSIDSNDSGIKITAHQSMNKELYNNDEDPKTKRKAQNRVAQRAFRERKERYVKKLENRIKQMQDDHVHITAQLSQENQQLKSVVCRLREHLFNSVGIQVEEALENKSWFSTANSSPNVNSLYTSPFKPLQIRPSAISSPVNQKKQKKHHTIVNKDSAFKSEKSRKKGLSPSISCQQIKFSISTPDTLRANSYNESARKSEHIPAVRLYPDHKHPANYIIGREKSNAHQLNITPTLSPTINYNSSCSVASGSSDEDEENTVINGNDQELSGTLKSFLGPHDTSSYINDNGLSSALILKQFLQASTNTNP